MQQKFWSLLATASVKVLPLRLVSGTHPVLVVAAPPVLAVVVLQVLADVVVAVEGEAEGAEVEATLASSATRRGTCLGNALMLPNKVNTSFFDTVYL